MFANPLDVRSATWPSSSHWRNRYAARRKAADDKSAISSFEQLVQVGAQAGGATPDANDRHIVRIVDWLWQYAF